HPAYSNITIATKTTPTASHEFSEMVHITTPLTAASDTSVSILPPSTSSIFMQTDLQHAQNSSSREALCPHSQHQEKRACVAARRLSASVSWDTTHLTQDKDSNSR